MFKVSSFVMGLKFFPVNLKEKSLDNVFIPVRKGMMIQFFSFRVLLTGKVYENCVPTLLKFGLERAVLSSML